MYCSDKNIFTIDIPKTACVTRWNIAKELYGRRILSGHMSMSFAADRMRKKLDIDYHDVSFWTVIRHPEKRLLSGLNYHQRQTSKFHPVGTNINDYMAYVRDSKYWDGNVFRSQQSWLDLDDVELKLWPLEHYDDFLFQLGWNKPVPRDNESYKTWNIDDLRNSSLYKVFMSKYDADWDLYQKALSNFS